MRLFKEPGKYGVGLSKYRISNISAALASDQSVATFRSALKYAVICDIVCFCKSVVEVPLLRHVTSRRMVFGDRCFEKAWWSYFKGPERLLRYFDPLI